MVPGIVNYTRNAEGELERAALRVVDSGLSDSLSSIRTLLRQQGRLLLAMAAAIDKVALASKVTAGEVDASQEVVFSRVLRMVSHQFNVSPKAIMGRNRSASVVRARHVVMLLCRRRDFSFQEIGTAMGRDHSTIICGVKTAERREHESKKMARDIAAADALA